MFTRTVVARDTRALTTLTLPSDGDALAIIQSAVRNGGRVLLPSGTYALSGDLHVDEVVTIEGAGAFGDQRTTLSFADGKGVIIHRTNTSPVGGDGMASVLRNVEVAAATKGVSGKHGVTMYARAHLEHVRVAGFSGHGVAIIGGAGEGPGGVNTNANYWSMTNVHSQANDGCGFYLIGSDANAGVGTHLNAIGNGSHGIHDVSFLGNTFIQAHTASNGGRAFFADGDTQFSVWVGMYSESGQEPSFLGQYGISIGGDHGSGFATDSVGTHLDGGPYGAYTYRPFSVRQTNAGRQVTVTLGSDVSDNTALALQSDEAGSTKVTLRYGNGRAGYWGLGRGTDQVTEWIAGGANADGVPAAARLFNTGGFHMLAPNGTVYQVTVGNDGVLATAAVAAP